jgi:hypothetical protein
VTRLKGLDQYIVFNTVIYEKGLNETLSFKERLWEVREGMRRNRKATKLKRE